MALPDIGGLRTIPEPARPNARATGRLVVKQTHPLRSAATPRTDQLRPKTTARHMVDTNAKLVFNVAADKPDPRRF